MTRSYRFIVCVDVDGEDLEQAYTRLHKAMSYASMEKWYGGWESTDEAYQDADEIDGQDVQEARQAAFPQIVVDGIKPSVYHLKPLEEQWMHATGNPGTQECFPGLFAYAGFGCGDLWTSPHDYKSMTSSKARDLCKERGWKFTWFDSFNYVLELLAPNKVD